MGTKWEVNVVVPAFEGIDPKVLVQRLVRLLGPTSHVGCVIRADGTPGARDAAWWRDTEVEAAMLREKLDTELEVLQRGGLPDIVAVTGPEAIG